MNPLLIAAPALRRRRRGSHRLRRSSSAVPTFRPHRMTKPITLENWHLPLTTGPIPPSLPNSSIFSIAIAPKPLFSWSANMSATRPPWQRKSPSAATSLAITRRLTPIFSFVAQQRLARNCSAVARPLARPLGQSRAGSALRLVFAVHGWARWSSSSACDGHVDADSGRLAPQVQGLADRSHETHRRPRAKPCPRKVTPAPRPSSGDILCLHDGDYAHPNGDRTRTLAALEYWLPRWRDLGLEFVTMREINGKAVEA